MTDRNFALLQQVVERCVAPVRVSRARQAQIREELLAHVLAVFEVELNRQGTEARAIQETLRRFGNPAEIAEGIRASTTALSYAGWLRDGFFLSILGMSMLNHNRIYNLLVALLGFYCLASTGLVLFLLGMPEDARPQMLVPQGALPLLAAINGIYLIAIVATLAARVIRPAIGRRITTVLNWLFLIAPPFGTVLGIYGLCKVDREPGAVVAGS